MYTRAWYRTHVDIPHDPPALRTDHRDRDGGHFSFSKKICSVVGVSISWNFVRDRRINVFVTFYQNVPRNDSSTHESYEQHTRTLTTQNSKTSFNTYRDGWAKKGRNYPIGVPKNGSFFELCSPFVDIRLSTFIRRRTLSRGPFDA